MVLNKVLDAAILAPKAYLDLSKVARLLHDRLDDYPGADLPVCVIQFILHRSGVEETPAFPFHG